MPTTSSDLWFETAAKKGRSGFSDRPLFMLEVLSYLSRLAAFMTTPPSQQRIPFHTRRIHVVVLHVTVTAHRIRQVRQFYRERQLLRCQSTDQLLHERLVIRDQRPFHLPFFSLAEDIERCTAQELHLR